LVKDHPKVSSYQGRLGDIYQYLGIDYQDLKDGPNAKAAHQKALDIYEQLARDQYDVPAYQVLYAGRHNDLGDFYRYTGQPDQAKAAYQQALTILEQVVRKYPDSSDYQRTLASTLARLGEHVRATEEMKAGVSKASLWPYDVYAQARVYALFSLGAPKDASLSVAQRENLADHYAAHAVELLRKAQTDGYFKLWGNVRGMKKDKDLDPLRQREDFKKLLAELEAKANTGTK
jgi:tetratricopeptide (TPR) repeat protein